MNKFGDPEIIKWLNKDIKCWPAIVDLDKQFQNWFIFQEVLNKTGNPLTEILLNKFDEQTTQKNFKIVKKHVIKMNGIEPKVEKGKSLIEEYLRVIQSHSKPIMKQTFTIKPRDTSNVLSELTKTLKLTDKKQIQSLQINYEEEFIKTMQPKLMKIEKEIRKFRDQKVIHEIESVKIKQQDEERERQWLQSLREVELDKIRAAHEFIKEQDKKIYYFWAGTEKVKHDRIRKEHILNEFMTSQMKKVILEHQKDDFDAMQKNINLFYQACIRQGVEIEKDPTKKPVQEKAKFSAVATMMKIKDRTRKNEEARKARQKRRNKMMVDQQKQQEEIEAKKQLDDLLDNYNLIGIDANKQAHRNLIAQKRGEMQFNERVIQSQNMESERERFFAELQVEANKREKQLKIERLQEFRVRQLEYMQINYDRKKYKREKHINQMQPLILSLLDLTDQCYLQMQASNSKLQLDNKFWKQFVQVWQKSVSELPAEKVMHDKDDIMFQSFYLGLDQWRPLNHNQIQINQDLARYLFDLVDHLYPIEELSKGIDYLLPLKISIIGGRFSGRKTSAKYLNIKYGLEIIDIEQVIKEAIKLANPPPEDPKKKKDPKKPEAVIIDNPELKEYGQLITPYGEKIPDELILKGILLKLQQTFGVRTPQIIEEEMVKAQQAFQQQKEQVPVEEVKKPAPKKAGKAPPPVQTGPTQEELLKEYISSKQFYYTKGWIMVGFPENEQQARLLELSLTGYKPFNERINEQAEELKRHIGQMVQPAIEEESDTLINSGTDLIIYLDTPLDLRIQRLNNRRADPTNPDIIYNLEENPPPPEIKLDKLLKVDGENEEKLKNEFQTFQQNIQKVIEWSSKFGKETNNQRINQFVQIQPKGKGLETVKQLDQYIDAVLKINTELFMKLAENPKTERPITRESNKPQSQNQQRSHEGSEHAPKSSQSRKALTAPNDDDVNEFYHHILSQWEETSQNYQIESCSQIQKIFSQRNICMKQFNLYQIQFKELFEEQDTKLELLNNFQKKYNKFVEENTDLSKQKNAKQQLQEHLQVVYESLWDVLNQKKSKAVNFLENLKKERYVISQIKQFLQHIFMLLQVELNYLFEINLFGKEWQEHFILEPPSSQLVDGNKFPQLERLFEYYLQSITFVNNLDPENIILQTQSKLQIDRAFMIKDYAISRMKEMILMEELLYERIEDWIVIGIKKQNDFCYQSVEYFKECIRERIISRLQIPEPAPLSEDFQIITISEYNLPYDGKYDQIVRLIEQIKSISDKGLIKKDILLLFLQGRIKSLKKYNLQIDKIYQKLKIQENKIHTNAFAILLLLWEQPIPSDEEFNDYTKQIKCVEYQKFWEFCDIPLWFEIINEEYNENLVIKRALFNIIYGSDPLLNLREAFKYFKGQSGKLFSEYLIEL